MSGEQKFRKGQVVMIVRSHRDGHDHYPVKLDHVTRIGCRDGVAWMDTLDNVEYESEMRPLTKREAGR
jgi:hypothetical protein